jgi:Lrp/AsnC family leucine-responsive transcriptional regulator
LIPPACLTTRTTLVTRLDGIASIESSFALSQVKYSIALPV